MKPGGAPASAAVLSKPGRRAAAQGGVDLPVERALVAAAGAGRAQERADLEAALVQAGLARRVRVMADGEVALSTAFADGAGIIVSAGTGSIAYARDPAGQLHRGRLRLAAGGRGWRLLAGTTSAGCRRAGSGRARRGLHPAGAPARGARPADVRRPGPLDGDGEPCPGRSPGPAGPQRRVRGGSRGASPSVR